MRPGRRGLKPGPCGYPAAMSDPTSDAEDFADYTDAHEKKPPPATEAVRRGDTPDVADHPGTEPPD